MVYINILCIYSILSQISLSFFTITDIFISLGPCVIISIFNPKYENILNILVDVPGLYFIPSPIHDIQTRLLCIVIVP